MYQEIGSQINKMIDAKLEGIHTALPGKIISFDTGTCMATVKPCATYNSNGKKVEYPNVSGVPVMFPCSKTAGVYFPVSPGDKCLLIFSEEELDNVLYGSEADGGLRFDLTSAIAIPGMLSFDKSALQEACSESRTVVCGGLKVKGDITYTGTCKQGE